ncbi:MAG: NAD(P)/FAD-dependent oxidoreductase [bacterium]
MPLEPDRRPESCIVVGAGMAGLMAARRLTSAGVRVLVVDKGRGVGGRMATRRAPGLPAGRAGVWDHGAQFFTAREEAFRTLVSGWLDSGVAQIWADAFPGDAAPEASRPHPRYRGTSGMAGVAKFLARGLDVHLSARVVALRLRDRRWQLETEAGDRHVADAVVLTPPVPQSLSLLDAGGVKLHDSLRSGLEGIAYAPCIAILARLEGRSAVPEPGGVRLSGEPLAWIADNRVKGISPEATTLTLHAGPVFSRAQWDSDLDGLARFLLEQARPWLGTEASDWQVHRWLYSQPTVTHPNRCVSIPDCGAPLVLCGDAFGGPRVEGAALSGIAAAARLLGADAGSRDDAL